MSFFERWLTLWVFLCIVAGTAVGVAAPELAQAFAGLAVAQVNIPVAR
jgi:ACR3 family arsenite transporter